MSIMVPNAAFVGHLMGIMSGLLIKFCGFSCFLPGYNAIEEFERTYNLGDRN